LPRRAPYRRISRRDAGDLDDGAAALPRPFRVLSAACRPAAAGAEASSADRLGGRTDAAYSRAARLASGWYGFALDVDGAKQCIDGVRARASGKDGASTSSSQRHAHTERERLLLDRADAERFAALGRRRLIVYSRVRATRRTCSGLIDEAEKNLIGKV